MVTLLQRSAGRHHRTQLRGDGEGLGDWGLRKSLQTAVCNALWESRSPRTARRDINQTDARDQESSPCCHILPPSPPCDWLVFIIHRFELFFPSVISRLQSYRGLGGDHYCEPPRGHESRESSVSTLAKEKEASVTTLAAKANRSSHSSFYLDKNQVMWQQREEVENVMSLSVCCSNMWLKKFLCS